MAIEVYKNLFIGDLNDCTSSKDYSIVHACKDPCHKIGVGYTGNLSPKHPNYLIKTSADNLYLNMVDMAKIDSRFTDPMMFEALKFIKSNLDKNNKVLIHCNLGQSRSCAIGMLYLTKNKVISNEDFNSALNDFRKLYPAVNLGIGFTNYLNQNWSNLISKELI